MYCQLKQSINHGINFNLYPPGGDKQSVGVPGVTPQIFDRTWGDRCSPERFELSVQLLTKCSPGDEIANVNCLRRHPIRTTKYSRLAHRPQCFTIHREQQVTITTVKRNLNKKLQVNNGEINFVSSRSLETI